MSISSVLDALQGSALAHAVSKSDHLVGASLQVLHIFGIVLLLSSLVFLSLRLLGWVFAEVPLAVVVRESRRFFRIGLALAVLSGVLIFIATAHLYAEKWIFLVKMALFAAALLVHVLLLSRVVRQQAPSILAARATVALTLVLWFGVGFAGRLIGFV